MPSPASLRLLLDRLGRHEPDIADNIRSTVRAQQNRERRERAAAEWREGGQSLVRALRAFERRTAGRHWEDHAYGQGRHAGSIGLAMTFLGGGGIPRKDLDFVKNTIDRNEPVTRTRDLFRLLYDNDRIAYESEYTVVLALYAAATLGYDIMNDSTPRKMREYSAMINDKDLAGQRETQRGGKGRRRRRVTTKKCKRNGVRCVAGAGKRMRTRRRRG